MDALFFGGDFGMNISDNSLVDSEVARTQKFMTAGLENYIDENIDGIIKEFEPNELGSIPVVMYHNLVEKEEDEGLYARSYANLRKDLVRLIEEGYVPITTREWVSGKIDVPAGKTPVVLTFDDGHPTDFQFGEDGKPTDECVVGIMESLVGEYPDFVPKATFYLNGPAAFGDYEYDPDKISYLLEHGYEVANHTTNHLNLSTIPIEQAKEEILSQAKRLEAYTGEKRFSFSVPFGEKFDDYDKKIKEGLLGDYYMISSVNVGWCPTYSVYSKDFNELSIDRITCGEDDFELYYWLDDLKNNPEKRFISDGIASAITIPSSLYENYDRERFLNTENRVIVYDDETYKIVNP